MLRTLTQALLTTLALALSAGAGAQQAEIEPLSQLDEEHMENQRDSIGELARLHLGQQLRGEVNNDLGILQELLDRRLVRPDQRKLLQAMGVVLGNLLAEKEDLDWVIYTDRRGRSRALRVPMTDEVLFPITMISRRVEAGIDVDVREIYAEAREIAQRIRERRQPY